MISSFLGCAYAVNQRPIAARRVLLLPLFPNSALCSVCSNFLFPLFLHTFLLAFTSFHLIFFFCFFFVFFCFCLPYPLKLCKYLLCHWFGTYMSAQLFVYSPPRRAASPLPIHPRHPRFALSCYKPVIFLCFTFEILRMCLFYFFFLRFDCIAFEFFQIYCYTQTHAGTYI